MRNRENWVEERDHVDEIGKLTSKKNFKLVKIFWECESPVNYAREKERKYKNYSMCLVCKSTLYGDVQLQLRSNTRPRNESIPQSLSFFRFFSFFVFGIFCFLPVFNVTSVDD